ncbi:MAG: peptidoglycan-binding protein [Stellaceae bacterium]
MRSLVLATVSALALGIAGAGPVYAQGNAGATSPAPATPSAMAPANPAQPAMPQAGTTTQSPQGSMSGGSRYGSSPYMANSGASSLHPGAMHATGSDIRQAQEQLKGEGLYDGKIDGRDGPKTRAAIRQFQKKNSLPVTARLDQSTLNELNGGMNQNMGQGSSMPPGNATGMTPPAPSSAAGTNESTNTGTATGTSSK